MMSQVIGIQDNSAVWRVTRGRCRACGVVAVAVQHMDCPKDSAECPACRARQFAVTDYELDGRLYPRLGALN